MITGESEDERFLRSLQAANDRLASEEGRRKEFVCLTIERDGTRLWTLVVG